VAVLQRLRPGDRSSSWMVEIDFNREDTKPHTQRLLLALLRRTVMSAPAAAIGG
jgi:hypothetical protein